MEKVIQDLANRSTRALTSAIAQLIAAVSAAVSVKRLQDHASHNDEVVSLSFINTGLQAGVFTARGISRFNGLIRWTSSRP